MEKQNQIKRTLALPASIETIRDLLENKELNNRTRLARRVCEEFKFYDTRDQVQISGCLKALRELEAAGHFSLPAVSMQSGHKPGQKLPRRLASPLPPPVGVPAQAGDVEGLKLVLVDTDEQLLIWNELMITEHPLGAGPLVGRQLRYLISSPYGWLGGFGFAAPALQLADRDAWIGWDQEQRQSYLHVIVGMSRFLIRPSVECNNLASKVLSMSMRIVADDFEKKYHYRPLLIESFVDTSHYSGACYKAANWIEVGKTKGRGRQDRLSESRLSVKAIFLYPLEKDFRKQMGLSSHAGLGSLELGDGLDGEHWAEHEFGGAPLGDNRLSKRLVSVAAAKAEEPGRAFSGIAKGDWPAVKAYYRMIDQPETSEVTLSNILAPHRVRTVRRMMGQKTVLCVQDGSELNYTNLDKCSDLAVLKANQTSAKRCGLNLHSTLAVAPNGLPLGVLKAQCLAPAAKNPNEKRAPPAIPIEEKKTFVWIEHHRDLVELAGGLSHTRLIDVCDREADFFELFDEQRQHSCVDLLIRAKHNRSISKEPYKLFAAAREAPEQSRILLPIMRQSARPKKTKQKKRPARVGRVAEMVIHTVQTQLQPPEYFADKPPIDISVVHAVEENPPADTKAIEWFLLTTIKVSSAADAEQCLRWYALRWRIEDWYRVLKSGCRIGDLAHESAERLRRAIGINLVIAWRIMLMTLMGRETPELPAELLFSDIELRTLQAFARKKGLNPPSMVGEAVLLVAKIGGYLGRNSDPPPGHQLLWQGYTKFQILCFGFALLEGD